MISIFTIIIVSIIAILGVGNFLIAIKNKKKATMLIGILFYSLYLVTITWALFTNSIKF